MTIFLNIFCLIYFLSIINFVIYYIITIISDFSSDFITVGCTHSRTLSSYVGTVFIPAYCCSPLLTTLSVLSLRASGKMALLSTDKHSQVAMKQIARTTRAFCRNRYDNHLSLSQTKPYK